MVEGELDEEIRRRDDDDHGRHEGRERVGANHFFILGDGTSLGAAPKSGNPPSQEVMPEREKGS